jgi:hypothetical protein
MYNLKFGILWFNILEFDILWFDILWFDILEFDILEFDILEFDILWFNILWFDKITQQRKEELLKCIFSVQCGFEVKSRLEETLFPRIFSD